MKSKKFLIFYLAFIFSFFILKTAGGREEFKKYPKVIIILTDRIEPIGRVICQSWNRTIIYEWKGVNYAILELKELKDRYGDSKDYDLFIQYDKWPY